MEEALDERTVEKNRRSDMSEGMATEDAISGDHAQLQLEECPVVCVRTDPTHLGTEGH